MTTDQFCFWLQGLIEVGDPKTLDERQVQIIKDHLKLVFEKKTPERNIPNMQWIPGVQYNDPLHGIQSPPYKKIEVTC